MISRARRPIEVLIASLLIVAGGVSPGAGLKILVTGGPVPWAQLALMAVGGILALIAGIALLRRAMTHDTSAPAVSDSAPAPAS